VQVAVTFISRKQEDHPPSRYSMKAIIQGFIVGHTRVSVRRSGVLSIDWIMMPLRRLWRREFSFWEVETGILVYVGSVILVVWGLHYLGPNIAISRRKGGWKCLHTEKL